MPFRLSDPAWLAFQNNIDVSKLNLPPWGGVVQWGSQFILVYICPQDGTICRKGEVMLTDVSDRQELLTNVPRGYDSTAGVWVYQLPAQLMATIYNDSKTVLEATGQIIQKVAETAGQAAGGLTKPLLENLTIPLVIVGVVVAAMYLPKSR
jgi:hypothetical protein